MRLKLLITGLLIGFLVSCRETNNNPTISSTPESSRVAEPIKSPTEPNEFDGVSFPQDSCGDTLPNNPKAYPVRYYPIFIDYSKSNLQSVKSKYCGDASKLIREKTGKDAIQVASFLSIERANKFSKFMINKIGSGEVGEPTVIEAKHTTEENGSPVRPSASVGKAAQLTDSQVQKLMLLEKNTHLEGFKVLLPTYLPVGFRVDDLETLNNNDTNPEYKLVYRNLKDNSCFRLTGDNGQWGGPPADYSNTVEALSPILGKVILEYTEFEQQVDGSLIKFKNEPIMKDKTGYSFSSDSSIHPNCRNGITPQEAVKIVESLQYLNP